tara:strand:- start:5232 stop:5387 length:156 start_codon:yes stop_codon:yes gene_type:complete
MKSRLVSLKVFFALILIGSTYVSCSSDTTKENDNLYEQSIDKDKIKQGDIG